MPYEHTHLTSNIEPGTSFSFPSFFPLLAGADPEVAGKPRGWSFCQKKRVRSHTNSTCKPATPPPLASFFSLSRLDCLLPLLSLASLPASNQKAAAALSPLDALQLPPGSRISSETTPPARHPDWPSPRGTRGPFLGPLQGLQVLMSLCPHALGPIREPDACDGRKPLQSLGGNQRYGICCCQGPSVRAQIFFISRQPVHGRN